MQCYKYRNRYLAFIQLCFVFFCSSTISARALDPKPIFFNAVLKGNTIIVEDFLFKKVVDVNARSSPHERTALIYAAGSGHIAIVETLIAYGADVNLQDVYGATALIHAVQKNHVEIVKKLVANGADVNMVDNSNHMSALMIAEVNRNQEIFDILKGNGNRKKITENLPTEVADIQEPQQKRWTGGGNKRTEWFTIKSKRWYIDWEFIYEDIPVSSDGPQKRMLITAFKQGSDIPSVIQVPINSYGLRKSMRDEHGHFNDPLSKYLRDGGKKVGERFVLENGPGVFMLDIDGDIRWEVSVGISDGLESKR